MGFRVSFKNIVSGLVSSLLIVFVVNLASCLVVLIEH